MCVFFDSLFAMFALEFVIIYVLKSTDSAKKTVGKTNKSADLVAASCIRDLFLEHVFMSLYTRTYTYTYVTRHDKKWPQMRFETSVDHTLLNATEY